MNIQEFKEKKVIQEVYTINTTLSATTQKTSFLRISKKTGYYILIKSIGVNQDASNLSGLTIFIESPENQEKTPQGNGIEAICLGSREKPTEINLLCDADVYFKYKASGNVNPYMVITVLYLKK